MYINPQKQHTKRKKWSIYFMNQVIYIKVPQCIQVQNPKVYLKDFLTLYTTDSHLKAKILSTFFHNFSENEDGQLIVSILKIIEFIQNDYPNLTIENLGEKDFIIQYKTKTKLKKCKENFFTIFICLVAFFGGGYAIMAYNTDIAAKELFTYLSMIFLGNPKSGVFYIAISYAIGLTIGLLTFLNHLGRKKFISEPSPLEIQMRLYEKDVSTTIIKDISRRGENFEVK